MNINNHNSILVEALDLADIPKHNNDELKSWSKKNPYTDLFISTAFSGGAPYVHPFAEESANNMTLYMPPCDENWVENVDVTIEIKQIVDLTSSKFKKFSDKKLLEFSPLKILRKIVTVAKKTPIKLTAGTGAILGYLSTNQKANDIYHTADTWLTAKQENPEIINNLLYYVTRWSENPETIDSDLQEIQNGKLKGNTWKSTCFELKRPTWKTATTPFKFIWSFISLEKSKIRAAFNNIIKNSPLQMRNLATFVYLNEHPDLCTNLSPEFKKLYDDWNKQYSQLPDELQNKLSNTGNLYLANITEFANEIKSTVGLIHNKPNIDDLKTLAETLNLSDGYVIESFLNVTDLIENTNNDDIDALREIRDWSRKLNLLNEKSLTEITHTLSENLQNETDQTSLREVLADLTTRMPKKAGTISMLSTALSPIIKWDIKSGIQKPVKAIFLANDYANVPNGFDDPVLALNSVSSKAHEDVPNTTYVSSNLPNILKVISLYKQALDKFKVPSESIYANSPSPLPEPEEESKPLSPEELHVSNLDLMRKLSTTTKRVKLFQSPLAEETKKDQLRTKAIKKYIIELESAIEKVENKIHSLNEKLIKPLLETENFNDRVELLEIKIQSLNRIKSTLYSKKSAAKNKLMFIDKSTLSDFGGFVTQRAKTMLYNAAAQKAINCLEVIKKIW